MKILLFFVFVILYAACVHSNGVRVKRGLSSDQQKVLVDALNEDRRKIEMKLKFTKHEREFAILKYDIELEKKAEAMKSGGECYRLTTDMIQLKADRHTFETSKYNFTARNLFFDPLRSQIGCNTEFSCSHMHEGTVTSTLYGLCILGPAKNPSYIVEVNDMSQIIIPSIHKYGDLLGVVESSGRVFSLTVFIAILFFYY